MDALQNLYSQVNQQQQQQRQVWPQQQQKWPQQPNQPLQSQNWPPQQQGYTPQNQWSQQKWPQEQQKWPENTQKFQHAVPNRPNTQWPPQQVTVQAFPQQQQLGYTGFSSQVPSSSNQQQQFFQKQPQLMYDDGFGAYNSMNRYETSRAGGIMRESPLPPAIPLKKRLSDAILPSPSAIKRSSRQQQEFLNTLTEPVSATLARDIKRVAHNLQQIIIPSNNRADPARTLRDWDLWGPFFFIITLSCILSSTATDNKSTVFAVVFAVLSSGAVSLTMNVVLLGGKLNFYQSLSVLGYCLFPLNIGAVLSLVNTSKLYRTLVVFLALMWCSWSVYPFVSTVVRPSRKALAVYPVFLMYISVGFFVLANV